MNTHYMSKQQTIKENIFFLFECTLLNHQVPQHNERDYHQGCFQVSTKWLCLMNQQKCRPLNLLQKEAFTIEINSYLFVILHPLKVSNKRVPISTQQPFKRAVTIEEAGIEEEDKEILGTVIQQTPGLRNQDCSDEAHFWLNGYVNKQNCRIWSEANPQVYIETPLHPEKLTVWCAVWAGGIIGPYFFKNDESHNVTVNGDRYRAMITNFFIPELNNHDVQELWFQQDGATCHTARATIDLLRDTFGDRLISRFGPVNWPPKSCYLTPLDCFLWGYVKSWVYADKPQALDHLEYNIRRVIADIRPQMLEKVMENWSSRLDYIRASRGSPMPEIIFKM
ncbi:DUF4817 domain-containing protein [Trichonephila clavipes]|nr:DUF4817 domain-containing protein [Trichonephila clavipes]